MDKPVFCAKCYHYNADNPRGPGACERAPEYVTYRTSTRERREKKRISVEERNKDNDCSFFRVPQGIGERFVRFFNLLR